MARYVINRVLVLIPILFIISVISFVLIQLPPGDFLTTYIQQLEQAGNSVTNAEIEALKMRFGLDRPMVVQYFIWMKGILLHGDLGTSFAFQKPVTTLLGERLGWTLTISVFSTVFIWAVGVPIGIYSAIRQYSVFDYVWTFIGFIGLAVPSFLLALVVLWVGFRYLGMSAVGLFSPEFVNAPWSAARIGDLLKHIWVPVIVIGVSGTAGLIRVMRATLLDELKMQYVTTARAKGLPEWKVLLKYPVRTAINPIVSTIGWMLPAIVSGEVLVSTVMNIPTIGPLLLQALLSQDMYLSGSIVMILAALTVIGTLISDLLLVWLDPRIRFGGGTSQ